MQNKSKAIFFLACAFAYYFICGHIVRYLLGSMTLVPVWLSYLSVAVMLLPSVWLLLKAYPYMMTKHENNEQDDRTGNVGADIDKSAPLANIALDAPQLNSTGWMAVMRHMMLVVNAVSLIGLVGLLVAVLAGVTDFVKGVLALSICVCQFADAVISYRYPQLAKYIASNSLPAFIRRTSLFSDADTTQKHTLAMAFLFGILSIGAVFMLLRN